MPSKHRVAGLTPAGEAKLNLTTDINRCYNMNMKKNDGNHGG